MRKLSLVIAFALFGTYASALEQEYCKVTPVAGNIYVAGLCLELVNTCIQLPPPTGATVPPQLGDCFVELGGLPE